MSGSLIFLVNYVNTLLIPCGPKKYIRAGGAGADLSPVALTGCCVIDLC